MQAVRPLCPAHVIVIVIMTEGKLGLQQFAQGCTCAPGNIGIQRKKIEPNIDQYLKSKKNIV